MLIFLIPISLATITMKKRIEGLIYFLKNVQTYLCFFLRRVNNFNK